MDECLSQAEQRKQGSIVFPAIGTGNLGFPKTLVASIMLDSILKFSKNRTSSHVQEVRLALHPSDHQTIKVSKKCESVISNNKNNNNRFWIGNKQSSL